MRGKPIIVAVFFIVIMIPLVEERALAEQIRPTTQCRWDSDQLLAATTSMQLPSDSAKSTLHQRQRLQSRKNAAP
jgi:hypothetical protein